MAASIENGTFGTRSLEFTLSTLALVAAVARRLLKTWIRGNISRVLLNLISTSNHMFKREIWDKITEPTFLKF